MRWRGAPVGSDRYFSPYSSKVWQCFDNSLIAALSFLPTKKAIASSQADPE
ncbi:hypothetical protein [Cylindrospermum sp. FACHB-282]|uniref:hypothetical protein n=1 Tax=Cylindrospermum sp. FACHB-282 TaxID=2692794 RepID=UPI001A7E3E92|nr:hypothetical protein [Cylindrospermum sp. FACHB-282]